MEARFIMENEVKTDSVVDEQKEKPKSGQVDNYFQYVLKTLKEPDSILTEEAKGKHQFGLITIIAFLVLIFLSNFLSFFEYLDMARYFGFSDYFNYFHRTISYAIALAVLILVYQNVASKKGLKYDWNFFFEKLGAWLILPSIFLLLSIPFDLLNITIHSWISSLATIFLNIAVFMISYLYVARHDIKTAALFLTGFYVVYRLILLIL